MSSSTSARARALVELKVIASTGAGLLAGVAVTVLNQTVGDEQLLGAMPTWGQTLTTMFVPPVVTFLAGWSARHTPRPDVDQEPADQAPNVDPLPAETPAAGTA